jgi:hypothetical protein
MLAISSAVISMHVILSGVHACNLLVYIVRAQGIATGCYSLEKIFPLILNVEGREIGPSVVGSHLRTGCMKL